MASLQNFLAMMFRRQVRATGTPTYVVAVKGALWKRYLQPRDGIPSEFVPGRFANYLLLDDNDGPWRINLAHEYTHFFLRTQVGGRYPLWFDEGMAGFIEDARPQAGKASIYPWSSFQPGWMPIERVLRVVKSSPEYRDEPSSTLFHQESWAIIHKGFGQDRKFASKIFAYMRALDERKSIDVALAEGFGMNAPELDKTVRAYINAGHDAVLTYEFDRPKTVMPGPGRLLSEFDVALFLANIMFESGFNPERVIELVDVVAKISPDSNAVKVLKMRLAARDHDDAALDLLTKDVSASTADRDLVRGAGLALFERVREENSGDSLAQTAARTGTPRH